MTSSRLGLLKALDDNVNYPSANMALMLASRSYVGDVSIIELPCLKPARIVTIDPKAWKSGTWNTNIFKYWLIICKTSLDSVILTIFLTILSSLFFYFCIFPSFDWRPSRLIFIRRAKN